MPSYDKPKLLKMLEQRRAAFLGLRDLNERLRDAQAQRAHLSGAIRSAATEQGANFDAIDRLLAMPVDAARRLSKEEVEIYEIELGSRVQRYLSGISFETFQRYLDAREKVERLQQQLCHAQEAIDARFAIVPRLIEAVRGWGFRDPELEI